MSDEGSNQKHVGWLQASQMSGVDSKKMNELSIPELADLIKSSDNTYWLSATVECCRLLSREDAPRKEILESRVVCAFILFLTEKNNLKLQVEAAKALRYLATGTFDVTKVTISEGVNLARKTLKLLMYSKDKEVLRHACCSLAVLSGSEHVNVRKLIRESSLYGRLLELIRHPTLIVAALRTLGNIVKGDEHMIERIIQDKVLVYLRDCLLQDPMDVRKECCWIISYIIGKRRWLQAVIDADLIGSLVDSVKKGEFVVMEAAVRAISNAAFGASREQIRVLVTKGCIEALCSQFCCRNSELFNVCLEGLESIFVAGESKKRKEDGVHPYAKHIENIQGWAILVKIAGAYEKQLFKKALVFIKKYGPMSPSRIDRYLYDNNVYGYFSRDEDEDEDEDDYSGDDDDDHGDDEVEDVNLDDLSGGDKYDDDDDLFMMPLKGSGVDSWKKIQPFKRLRKKF